MLAFSSAVAGSTSYSPSPTFSQGPAPSGSDFSDLVKSFSTAPDSPGSSQTQNASESHSADQDDQRSNSNAGQASQSASQNDPADETTAAGNSSDGTANSQPSKTVQTADTQTSTVPVAASSQPAVKQKEVDQASSKSDADQAAQAGAKEQSAKPKNGALIANAAVQTSAANIHNRRKSSGTSAGASQEGADADSRTPGISDPDTYVPANAAALPASVAAVSGQASGSPHSKDSVVLSTDSSALTGLVSAPPRDALTPGTPDSALAFALQVQPNSGDPNTLGLIQPGLASPRGQNSFAKDLQSLTGCPAAGTGAPATPSSGPLAASFGPANSTAAAAEKSNPAAVVEMKADVPAVAQPLKSVQIQIVGADNERVDLRLVERGGSLSMSVRATDSGTTQALQDHLPDLSNRLADQHFNSEWWTPDTKASTSAQNDGSPQQRDANSQQQSESRDSSSGQQQGRQKNNDPDWVQELRASSGSVNNRREYIWHQ